MESKLGLVMPFASKSSLWPLLVPPSAATFEAASFRLADSRRWGFAFEMMSQESMQRWRGELFA